MSLLVIATTSLMDDRTLLNPGSHQAAPGVSILQGASHVNIQGSTFHTYGSRETDKKKRIADAMAHLASRAEQGAPYDAAAREDVPKCHEHTRVAIVDGIHHWAHSLEPGAPPLMWMYGPAGSGKTTIMQTVAETFDEEGSLAASFFFSRLSAARPRNKEKFVITLAHQLSRRIPALKQPLADALSDPDILTKSLAKQLDALIIGPLKKLDLTTIGACRVFLVDGLDECDGDTAQQDVLNLLDRFLHEIGHRIRILVASRSLSQIRSFFAHARIGEITQTTPLDSDYQSDEDVTRFLHAEFAKIRIKHPSCSGLASEWPSSSDVDILVKRTSGQFIYASVVMKFIADHGRHPHESLKTIVRLVVDDRAMPYGALDAVYAQVLSTIEPQNFEFTQTVMGCLLLPKIPGIGEFDFKQIAENHPTETLDDVVFMSEPGTTNARINRLSPLITISNDGLNDFVKALPFILSKSAPSEELATLLTRKFLHVQRKSINIGNEEEEEEDVESFFTAIIIYLFECGVSFVSEHEHGPDFHPDSWRCGICMLLDPFKAEYADIEISRDPPLKPLPDPTQIALGGPKRLQIHPIWNQIPEFPLIWLRAWIFWLVEIITRFFPVVA
ncbi:hypothetical protein D9619_013703 [Psilocybe cf. subviscida]|uniref:Nephrocystin 3-like N-terminal domain-containing protein n=1 Tax=Psilocybe cf. subviscida TaxID=2480587 RepID=A0A8H5B0L2_9AGAR|nr:hypothetical protein D9619_013703 [Psilocybe cf. subviscida]